HARAHARLSVQPKLCVLGVLCGCSESLEFDRPGGPRYQPPPMTTVVMPQLGESVVEGTVVRWIAQPGQRVERDAPLLEIATDKANTEIPSPSAGVLIEHLAKEGSVVAVGSALARLDEASTTASGPGA